MPGSSVDSFVRVQKIYWTQNPGEKAALLSRYDTLTWKERLRLHHLNCIEVWGQDNRSSLSPADTQEETLKGANYDLLRESIQVLLSADSPYRTRQCSVWQTKADASLNRDADHTGLLRNASVSHLGCVEVIRVDAAFQPQELMFVPFDDISAIMFGPPALYCSARVFYDDGRGMEEVIIPLLYGLSWFSDSPSYRDGTLTHFVSPVVVKHLEGFFSIGIGHQDFTLKAPEGGMTLFGIGSVAQITVDLDLADPHFDRKCRARGVDPGIMREQFSKPD